MPVSLREIEEAHLDTSAFERYLRAHNWEFEAETRGGARQWRSGESRMLLPAPESRGSTLRFYDALAVLAGIESKDTRVLLGAVANAAERTVVITVDEGDSARGGTIPLEAASEIVRGTTSLVEVAVSRALGGGSPYGYQGEYLRDVLFGPTTIGSFGLTVYLPEGGELVSDSVASELIRTVGVAEDLVDQESVLVRARREFSAPQFAQLTRSFVELLADDEARSVEFATIDEPAELRMRGTLQGAWLPRLRRASFQANRELELEETAVAAEAPPEEEVFEDVRLDGPVVALNRPWVTIEALTPRGRKRVRFRLGEPAYREAVTAHREERWVIATGLLRIRPRSAQLLQVTEFRSQG